VIRLFDVLISIIVIIILLPLIFLLCVIAFFEDRENPIFSATRVGRNGVNFTMFKVRTMKSDPLLTAVESTANDDPRITRLGSQIRKYKLDEFPQLLNVVLGQMSLVGPRPNTVRAVSNYSTAEQRLLSVRPGITDLASIVYSREGEILAGSTDPDAAYELLIRPGKALLASYYVENQNLGFYFRTIWWTGLSQFSREECKKSILKRLFEDPSGNRFVEVIIKDM
jgi:lipopolysaccharide/colanic/teichoic acid biosynthesis glycosyltransferase